MAFEELGSLQETNYLRHFVIPVHMVVSADISFNYLIFIEVMITAN